MKIGIILWINAAVERGDPYHAHVPILTKSMSKYTSKALIYANKGALEQVLSVHEYQLPALEPDSIIVKIVASSVNPSDVLTIMGN